MAQLNLFLMDQEDYEMKSQPLPAALVKEHKGKMGYLLHRVALLREQARAEGRWDQIAKARRDALEERERLALKTFAQFDKMLARAEQGPGGGGDTPGIPAAGAVSAQRDLEAGAGISGQNSAEN